MNISELKVGMRLRQHRWKDTDPDYREILAVGSRLVFFRTDTGYEGAHDFTDDGWIIVEPRKKPSERLVEILNEVSPRFDPAPTDILRVVSRYLDEKDSEQK